VTFNHLQKLQQSTTVHK